MIEYDFLLYSRMVLIIL